MNALRAGAATLFVLALLFVLPQYARADVRTYMPSHTLPKPANRSWQHFGVSMAIDGGHIIVLAINEGPEGGPGHTYGALLYRRNLSDGRWIYRRTLLTAVGYFSRVDVRMKSGIAAVQLGGNVTLFEYVGGDYVRANAPVIRHPGGVALSGNRLLVGGDNCNYDGAIYSRDAGNNWSLTGRLDDSAGECETEGLHAELNYDYAILRPKYGGIASAWRRNGTALEWIPSGLLNLPPDTGHSDKPYTLQRATAVGNNGYVWRRNGSSTWKLQGKATAVDMENSWGITFDAVYRDGILVTSESGNSSAPRVYLESSPGQFEHVATLLTYQNNSHIDVSGRTVAAVIRDSSATRWDVVVFDLPSQLRVPQPIVNDFEERDVSDFTFNSGQFTLAARGADDVLAQNSSAALAIALLTESDWTDYQRVVADIRPTYNTGDSWVGLIARYVDANNYYFAAIRANETFGVYKRVNGVNTLLHEGNYQVIAGTLVSFIVDGRQLSLTIGSQHFPIGADSALPRGRGGLITWQARADFDDVHVSGAGSYGLFSRDWGFSGSSYEVDLTTAGGDWRVITEEAEGQEYNVGLSQLDASGNALAFIGVPVDNQQVSARMRLDGYAASQQGAWFGLLARYVDARSYYYATVRSTGQIQIRRLIDGNITVLASASFSAVPGEYYDFRFRVINDQLQLYVNETLVASAHDGYIAQGRYGLATYRAAATIETLYVLQP